MRIFLIGLPGAGKSYWGKIWSSHHNLEFIDLDQEIEQASGKSIDGLFSAFGEVGFREWEQKVLMDLLNRNHFILACGGGTPCFGDNLNLMNEKGVTIYIDPEMDSILNNLGKDTKSRPLINGSSEHELKLKLNFILNQRISFYNRAKITICESELKPTTLETIGINI